MIGYVTVGTNDLGRATEYYDALMKELGANRLMGGESFVAWAVAPDKPAFSVQYHGNAATIGNGTMIALVVDSAEKVDAVHAKAMALGSVNEGSPGERMEGFYAGYFRDLDGNKLNVFCQSPTAA